MIRDFIALDIETTGLDPKRDKIIEIGAVKIRDGKEIQRFEKLINPARMLDEKITQLTGITGKDLEKAPYIEDILPELLLFCGDDVLLGHRILFDFSFIKRAAVNNNLSFEKQGIDTLKAARKLLPQLESRKLTFLCDYYGITYEAHRAGNDAWAAAQLYFRLADNFPEEEVFKPVPLIYKVKKENPATRQQKERLYKLVNRHKLVIDYDIDRLTRNEASRLADKIILKYGRL